MRSGFGLRLELRPCWIERRREYKLNVYVVRTMYFMNSIHFEIEIEPCSSSWPIQTSRYFPCFSCCVLRRVRCRGGPCTDPHSRRQIFPQVNVKTWKSVAYWFVLPSCCLPVAFLLPSCCLPVAFLLPSCCLDGLVHTRTLTHSPTHSCARAKPRTWNAGENEDCCGICRNAFEQAAPDCRYPGDESPVCFGVCSHAFHLQCINKWLSSQSESRCPLCRSAWEFKAAEEPTAA